MKSRYNNFTSLSCAEILKITNTLPTFSLKLIAMPSHIKLADLMFYKGGQVDILIEAHIF